MKKQYAVCTNDAILIDSLDKAKAEAEKILNCETDKAIYICEVIGKASNGIQWDIKRTRKTKVKIQVDSQMVTGGGGT